MNFLIAGGYDTQNLGDYASFLGLYKLLSARWPNSIFRVLSRHPEDLFSSQFNVETILNLDHPNKAASINRIFNGFNEGDSSRHLQVIKEAMHSADCLVLGNGRLFVDISLGFMKGPLSYFGLLVALARIFGKPVILSSVTLVHPQTEIGKTILAFILQNSQRILVREEASAIVAREYVKNTNKISVLPDLAFALNSDDADERGVPDVVNGAIGVNYRGVDYLEVAGNEKLQRMRNQLLSLLERTDRNIVFCHQCTYNIDTPITDDRHINELIYDSLPSEFKKRCFLFKNKWTLAQTLALYGKLSYLLTSRRHGFILSLTQGTPSYLLCNEINTEVVRESIPLPELYLSSDKEPVIIDININIIASTLNRLRENLKEYTKSFEYCLC